MAGSTDQISLNSEAIYSGYQSVNYAKKSMSSLFSLLSANNVDYSLISNLGFDYQSIINNLNEQYNKLTDYSSRLLKVKNILLKADPNNEYLFQQIDLQFIGMDMGDNPSETDLITYFNTMKKVYYTAKGKDINELSDFEKAIIKNYEESGYADFDEYQNLINEISQLKGEYSELNKQNQMGAGLGGYSISTDSEKYNENQNRLIELTKKLDELESRSSFLEKGLKEKGLLELSGWEELKIAGSKYIDTLKDFKDNIANGEFEEAHDNIKTLQATNAVVLGKVTSGILKIGEYVQDGVAMLETTGASVITLGIDAVFGTNYTDDMWKSTMDYVAIDQVGNIEKGFYENTSLGKELNDESILKYNSKGAESIKNASKKVGEMVAATAVTVATGGTAAPLVAAGIGFLEGTGQGGEKYFSMIDENGNYTNRNVKGIGLSYLEGIQKGSEWYISGQVGSGIYNGVKSFVNPASITKEVASRATGNTFKDAVVNTIKLPDMYVDFAAATAKAGAGYITNGEVNWKDYAFEMGFAVLGNFAGELLSAAGANKALKNQNKVSDGKTMLENIDEQIARANITSKETGAASQIKIHSIEDLTDKQLEAISDKQLVCFVVDSKKQPVSFEDAFIELKRSGKIPADSPLMKEYQNEITRQIQYANYRAGSHDNFMSVRVDSLGDLTDGQLRMIGNRDLVSFQVTSKNGEIVSFEDAFIELKRSGKIPADSPLMKEYQNEITRQIQYANYRAGSHDNFMSVRVDSLGDLTDGQLRMIGNRDLVSFQVTSKNGEIVSFEDAFIELKRSGKIPADSPLMKEYQNEITRQIQYANYRAGSHDNFMSVRVDSLDDLTFDQLQAIEKKGLVSFQVVSKNNEILSFEDVFDEYIKSNLHQLEVVADADMLRLIKQYDLVDESDIIRTMDNIQALYEEGRIAAELKYNTFLKNFREHRFGHASYVAEYADNLVKDVPNADGLYVLYGGITHDLGMMGGVVKIDGKYRLIDEFVDELKISLDAKDISGAELAFKNGLIDAGKDNAKRINGLSDEMWESLSKAQQKGYIASTWSKLTDIEKSAILEKWLKDGADGLVRKNHPLNSGILDVIMMEDLIPSQLDSKKVALLAMSHSKSTSGIKDYTNKGQWKECVDKLAQACNTSKPGSFSDADVSRLKAMIDNEKEFETLCNEALCIRDADAMAQMITTVGKDGKKIGLVMQPGGFSVVNNYAARGADFNIPVASADDEIKAIKDKLYFTDGKEPIEVTNNFSKKIHAGEGNLTFGSHFDGTSYTARIMPVEANEFPNSTFDAIDERLGEIITYTNCTQRKVEIVLPAAAKDTALGKFYKDALEKLKSKQLASITEQVVSGKMTKEIGDRCEEYIKHGLDVVFE